MSRFHVGGKVVENVDLLRKKLWTWRLDVWPFAVLYAIWVTLVVPSLDFADAAIVLGGLAGLHILVWLFTAWSVDFKCFVQYGRVNDIHHADACKITSAKFSSSKEVVPLHFRKLESHLNLLQGGEDSRQPSGVTFEIVELEPMWSRSILLPPDNWIISRLQYRLTRVKLPIGLQEMR